MMPERADALVIGAGFFGLGLANRIKFLNPAAKVVVIEREDAPFRRASFANQARVHTGYHYPRSFQTAFRARANRSRFMADFGDAVIQDFTKIYAVPGVLSNISAGQFRAFCNEIGAPIKEARPAVKRLFSPTLVEGVFEVVENAFDARVLRDVLLSEARLRGVEIRFGRRYLGSRPAGRCGVEVTLIDDSAVKEYIMARQVFVCTYAGLAEDPEVADLIKLEAAEVCLVEPPPEVAGLGVTVMDGPFFSCMPFPAVPGAHSLTHVRLTPHGAWRPDGQDPYQHLTPPPQTRFAEMMRDARRYLPAIGRVRHIRSLFEIKAVLQRNEIDDGRPILFRASSRCPGVYHVLGGKIDNIYDAYEVLENVLS